MMHRLRSLAPPLVPKDDDDDSLRPCGWSCPCEPSISRMWQDLVGTIPKNELNNVSYYLMMKQSND